MANKYIIHGATHCGDGTASNAAASAGDAGAWNDINVFEGTAPAYGTAPAAGDIVYIRSKTSAGADITRTLAASVTLGSSAATLASPIRWVVDAGNVWAGISGVLSYNAPSSYGVTIAAYNDIAGSAENQVKITDTNTSGNKTLLTLAASACLTNVSYDSSLSTNTYGDKITVSLAEGSTHLLRNCSFKLGRYYDSLFSAVGESVSLTLVNPAFNLTSLETNGGIFIGTRYGGRISCIGGSISGVGATTGANVTGTLQNSGGVISFVGTQIPRTMSWAKAVHTNGGHTIEAVGVEGLCGSVKLASGGLIESRDDNYYPTLDAFLPDSLSTPWAWKLYPSAASLLNALNIQSSKLFVDTSGVKTVKQEILVADTITLANTDSVWIDVTYVDDTTGLPKSCISRSISAATLTASSAGWSATTYGPVNLLKKSLAVTTPTAIKKDTLVTVTLFVTFKSASSNDIMFACPDISLT